MKHRFISAPRFDVDKELGKVLPRFCPKNAYVLDAGCGIGIYSQMCPGKKYLGIDIQPREEWGKYSKTWISFKKGDLRKLDERNELFDFALSVNCLEHVKEDKKAIREIYRVLKKSSYFVFTVPTRWYWIAQFGRHCYHHYSKKQLTQRVKSADFKIIMLKRVGGFFALLCHTFDTWFSYAALLPFHVFGTLSSNKQQKILNNTVHFHMNFSWGRKLHMLILKIIWGLDKIFYFLSPNYLIVLKK